MNLSTYRGDMSMFKEVLHAHINYSVLFSVLELLHVVVTKCSLSLLVNCMFVQVLECGYS